MIMSTQIYNLNNTYISKRVKQKMDEFSNHTLNTVIAPMGYGKTTAVDWYLKRLKSADVYRINIYSDNIDLFWERLKNAFYGTEFYNGISGLSFPDDDNSRSIFLDSVIKIMYSRKKELYIFFDDFHLLSDNRATGLLTLITKHAPERLHIIVAGRNDFLPERDKMELGLKLYALGKETLSLNVPEIDDYLALCGIRAGDDLIHKIYNMSEGWFSCVYLCLRYYLFYGLMPDESSDILTIMDEALLEPLGELHRRMIVAMCLADEFTERQAAYITQISEIKELLHSSVMNNAFINIVADGTVYRFHHMLKECAKKRFDQLSEPARSLLMNRYGIWYEDQGDYYKSIKMFHDSGDRVSMLRVIGRDQAEQLSYFDEGTVVQYVSECSDDEFSREPYAVLVLMRRYFSWRRLPEMEHLRSLLISSVNADRQMSDEERNNIIGECDLVMSFTAYNDINKMSAYHRSAYEKMTCSSKTMGRMGAWTFGSPSVLALFHRKSGELDKELAAMHESMPYYCRLTSGHGTGAEFIMQAEAEYLRGEMTDSEISIERAIKNASEKNQVFMLACCYFLKIRLSFFTEGNIYLNWDEQAEKRVKRIVNPVLMTVLDLCRGYYYSLMSKPEKIPRWLLSDKGSANILFPARPIAEIIRNMIMLMNKEYAKLLSGYDYILEICSVYPYELCKLYLLLQSASAYCSIGKRDAALERLREAVDIAASDRIIIPFAEYFSYIRDILPASFADKVRPYAERFSKEIFKRKNIILHSSALRELSEREKEIALLMGKGFRNRDIAEKLHLAEGSVKQYINHIYSKLMLRGTSSEKRRKLVEILKY